MAEIAAILRVDDDPRLPEFQLALRALGNDRRRAIEAMPIDLPIAPFNESMSKRMRWLEARVLSPLATLFDALSEANRPYFSEWPGDRRIPTRPDFADLAYKLSSLDAYAQGLHIALDYQLGMNAPHTSEMRYDIVLNLIDLLAAHFPEVPRTRGQYEKSQGGTVGRTPDYLRRAFQEITGSDERLDATIQSVVDGERRPQPKSG